MKHNLLTYISGAVMAFSVAYANSDDFTKTQHNSRSHSSASYSSVSYSSVAYSSTSYSSGYTTSQPSRTMHSTGAGTRTNEQGTPYPDGRTPDGNGDDIQRPRPNSGGPNSGDRSMPE